MDLGRLLDTDMDFFSHDISYDGTLARRLYYCRNWRYDVVALMTGCGLLKECVRCFSYGVPYGITLGDRDGDGDTDMADQTLAVGAWGTRVPKCGRNLDSPDSCARCL